MKNSVQIINENYSNNTIFNTINPPINFEHNYATENTNIRDILEKSISALENSNYTVVFNSYMSTLNAIVSGLLCPRDHVVCIDDCYGGTNYFLRKIGVDKWKIDVSFCDFSKINEYNIEQIKFLIKDNTKLVLIESITNPLLKSTYFFDIAKFIKQINPKIYVAVDNTLLTPLICNPLSDPAIDLVYQSGAYINGHADVHVGFVSMNDEALYEKVAHSRNIFGASASTWAISQTLRGMKTLDLRMERISRNAIRLAEYLFEHEKVLKVNHSSLLQYYCKEQYSSFVLKTATERNLHSGIMSVYLDMNDEQMQVFLSKLVRIRVAESGGGSESTVEVPALMSHKKVPAEMQEELDYTRNLLKFSVGIEDVNDLIKDIDHAFKSI